MMLGLLLIVIILIFAFEGQFKQMGQSNTYASGNQAVQILDERYAKGEISDEEYKSKKWEMKN